jgi:hypothetical protein
VQPASSHAAQVQYSRRSRLKTDGLVFVSSPGIQLCRTTAPRGAWYVFGHLLGLRGRGDRNLELGSPLPCLRGRALPSRLASHVVVWYSGLAWSLPESLLENTRLKIDGSWHWHVPLLYVYVVLRARALLSASRTASHSCSRH